MPRHDINWEEIRTAYVTGVDDGDRRVYPSVRALARRFGVAPNSIFRQCRREGWVRMREEYQRRIGAQVVQKTAERVAERMAHFNDAALEIALRNLENVRRSEESYEEALAAVRASALPLGGRLSGSKIAQGARERGQRSDRLYGG